MIVAANGLDSYNDYYPFGMQLTGRSYTSSADQRYKFTGKERDASTGLDYFGARYYDSWKGSWDQVDPMGGKYPGWSSYNYCVDNPGRFIDPNGADLGWYQDGRGQNKYNPDVHSQADMDKVGLKGKYISDQFQEVDTKTNLEISYNIDGTKQYGIMPLMNAVESTAKGNINQGLALIEKGKDISNFGINLGNNTITVGGVGMVGSFLTPGLEEFTPGLGAMMVLGAQIKSYSQLAHLGFTALETMSGGSSQDFNNELKEETKSFLMERSLGPIMGHVLPGADPEVKEIYNQFTEGLRAFSF